MILLDGLAVKGLVGQSYQEDLSVLVYSVSNQKILYHHSFVKPFIFIHMLKLIVKFSQNAEDSSEYLSIDFYRIRS